MSKFKQSTVPRLTLLKSDKTLFYPFTVSVNKCDGRCNTIDDPYVRVNETRMLVLHESCEFQFGLDKLVCNSKQKWNHNECRCECKE